MTPAERLAAAGFPDPEAEAAALAGLGAEALERRLAGEPLEWITGTVQVAGADLRIDRGVYVPRWETGALIAAAVGVLPNGGTLVDLCTGCGAVAAVVGRRRPDARVVATDADPVAVACARRNGVDCRLDDVRASRLDVVADVVTAVVPYVPTEALQYLPRDVREWEPRRALDGGPGGTTLLEAAVSLAARLLRPGGHLLLELGAAQDVAIAPALARAGFGSPVASFDDDGDLRAIEARMRG